VRLEHTAGTLSLSGGERPVNRSGHVVLEAAAEVVQVLLDLRVGEHPIVHRRADHHRCARGEQDRAEQVVGAAVRRPRDEVGGGRSDAYGVGVAPQADVQRRSFRREEVRERRPPGDALERERRDEALCRPGEDDVDLGAQAGQVTGDLDRFVRRDAPGDSEDDAPALPRPARLERGGRRSQRGSLVVGSSGLAGL
jgi:hypothetical protein